MNFDQPFNFRDFGGYPGRDGLTVVRERLYRSAALDRMSDADLAHFVDLDIGTVIDLRRWGERTASPSRLPENAEITVLETLERDVFDASHERYLGGETLTLEIVQGRMISFYDEVAYEEPHREIFRRAFETLAATDRPALVHCAAGKDRTGVFVALLHHILGVSEADRLAEYLKTAEDRRLHTHLEDRLSRAARLQERNIDLAVIHALIGVSPDYLDAMWQSLGARSGSVDGYLAEIGVGPETQAAIRSRYLA
jgi:protein tyrosine/serine phosphatase